MTPATAVPEPIPPQAVVMQMAMGALVTKLVAEATRLNIPDLVKRHGPMTAADLIAKGGLTADASALHRVLRACAGNGIFTEDALGRFGPTGLSDTLTADSPVSVKKIVELMGGMIYKVATELSATIRTGQPQVRAIFGLEFWDYLNANPKELEDFGEGMKSNSLSSLRGVLEKCDFADATHVADIGGGFGHLALALLQKYPHLQATVLDRPEVVGVAHQHLPIPDPNVATRLSYSGGNMFESVPQADVYIMKHIIHDWEDTKCVRLLENCARRVPHNGRVICVDTVLPPTGNTEGTSAKLLDIIMLTHITGKERTQQEWTALYHAAGLNIRTITPIQDNFGTSIIEGVKQLP
ncbi:MAG TPA: methyltransferase [Bryobacteraceae bacterium]|nr:methyltransferase [Bryobacteraceae bacterium]